MSFDISHLLSKWDYKPGEISVRRIKGRDGMEKIQLRVDLGILQMNAEGRPDGKQPFGHESLLEYYVDRLEKFRTEHDGDDTDFVLTNEDCSKLQQEAIQYHHRYICLYQLKDFDGVLRDADRNLEVFDFVDEFAESDDMAWSVKQFVPQLILMRTRALGESSIAAENHEEAVAAIEEAMEQLTAFYRDHQREDLLESSGELSALRDWHEQVRLQRPRSELEKLEDELTAAVSREDYETAATVRDALRRLKEAAEQKK